MNFKSAGEAINPHEVGYRSLGFGENPRIETTHYELIINTKELTDIFFKKADSFIHQCKIDDIQQGFADIKDLQDLNYANFKYLTEHNPNLASELLKDYLYFDLLDSLFPNSKNLKVAINDIKDIIIKDGNIIISGETFPFAKP
ncbi:hypothetical protein [Pseudomonas sp. BGI-2]|uniref:hypothetical protein n=1 Tax=Pseudomonas sp. BGI-2 TaxID=2528211 RepID=UPI0010339179|nr:hypothetical protein [Pseudomonas sp. BGI-2]TBN32522.1 hypothetical protein EYC95_28795 [Pseudomonas sp. BGI-2]